MLNIMTSSTYNKFGNKMKKLISLVGEVEDWREYVEPRTAKLIEDLLQLENISLVMEKNKISYLNLRAKYMVAIDRIETRKTNYIRAGKSDKSKKLFELIEQVPNWESALTPMEISYVKEYKELKNFYAVGRQLDVSPSNVAGALYGTRQREGVIRKIEKLKEAANS